MNDLIGWLILLCAIAVVEVRDFALVPALLGLQGLLFIIQHTLEGVGVELLPFAIFSILFVPATLYYITTKTKRIEEQPLIPGLPSIILLLIMMAIAYVVSFKLFTVEGIQLPLILAGIYGLLVKIDLRKIAASLSILINLVHFFTASFNVMVDISLMTLSAILLLMLLFFAKQTFLIKGSISTRDLKELRF